MMGLSIFKKNNRGWLLAVSVIVLLLIASLGARIYLANKDQLLEKKKQQFSALGFYWFDQPRKLSPVLLSDLSGKEKYFTAHSSGWRIVNTGYLFCPDICPINLTLLNSLKVKWQEKQNKKAINVVHLTFDPKRDTPELLGRYLEYINPSFYGLTGSVENIRQVTQQLNMVFIYEEPDKNGHYFITHSDSMAILNPQGEYVGLFKGPYNMDNMIRALELLVNQ